MTNMHRAIAIAIEVLILATLMFSLLWGMRLVLFDLGLRPKYKSIVTLALSMAGCLALVFFIVHLITFYPTLSR